MDKRHLPYQNSRWRNDMAVSRMTPSFAFSASWQFYFLMGVGRTPRAALCHDGPRTIQQPHTTQGDGSRDHNGEDYEHRFHEPAFYISAGQGSQQLDFEVNNSTCLSQSHDNHCVVSSEELQTPCRHTHLASG